MRTDEITIRSVQHYMYCAHRWGLMEIDRAWAENAFVTKANLMHERVHDPDRSYYLRGKKVFTSVSVYNDRDDYNLYGITDCLELSESNSEKAANIDVKKYIIDIVEYKPSQPKNSSYRQEDLMQVFAQKICVDYVFGGSCGGVIYYGDTKKRLRLPLEENFDTYDAELRGILKEMRMYLQKGMIPPVKKDQKCSGCSMKDLCMPKAGRKSVLRDEIDKIRSAPL